MPKTATAVEILRALRTSSAVLTPAGTGVVMVQSRGHVTVLIGRLVATYERWQVEEMTGGERQEVDWTDAEREWFAKPLRVEVVS